MFSLKGFAYLGVLLILLVNCISEKITIINVEHPHVEYYNKEFINYINLTTTRYGRSNPIYYVGVHYESVVSFDNNILFLTNQYKRSFIEIRYAWCTLLEEDVFFGASMRQGNLAKPCPHRPGFYHLLNMTINPAIIPRGFPFTRGRIQLNMTQAKTQTRIADGHIDMKILRVDKKKTFF